MTTMADRSARQLRRLVAEGKAMRTDPDDPRPGRFPIANREDLLNAIRAVGRVRPNTEEARARVRRFIMRRARRSEEHTSELQSRENLVCRLLLEKKKL